MKGHNPLGGIPPASQTGQNLPSFRRSNRNVGSGAGTTATPVIVFNPHGAASVRWILIQTSAACTLQLLLNQQPFSLPITVGAGAIIRFAGLFLANNEVLSISVTANSTLNFEVAWLKEIHPDTIVKDTAVIYAGSSTGSNTNVDIFDSTGQALNSDGAGHLGVTVSNFQATTHQIAPDQTGLVSPMTAQQNGAFNVTPAGYRGVMVTFKCGVVSGTSPTLQLLIQVAIGLLADGSIAWAGTSAIAVVTGSTVRLLVYPAAVAVTLAGAGGTSVNGPIPLNWRVIYGVAGTTPSIAISEIYFDYFI